MKAAVLTACLFTLTAGAAKAECFGSENFSTCTDPSGNTYSVSRFGNMTSMTGRNANGSTWSQQTQDLGSSSYTSGRAADGSSWNSNRTNFGSGGSMTTGTDSDGNSFSSYCDAYGNCY